MNIEHADGTAIEIDLGERDLIVITTAERATDAVCSRIRQYVLAAVNGDVKCIVLTGGMRLSVLHRDEIRVEEAKTPPGETWMPG